MARYTEKTARTSKQWVKITRDNKARTFTFARGYVGEFKSTETEVYSFKWVSNWAEAVEQANRTLATYA
jgi:hypothetical protein